MEIDEVFDDGTIDVIVPGAGTEVVRYAPVEEQAERERKRAVEHARVVARCSVLTQALASAARESDERHAWAKKWLARSESVAAGVKFEHLTTASPGGRRGPG